LWKIALEEEFLQRLFWVAVIFESLCFIDTTKLGSVVMHLGCGGIFSGHVRANFPRVSVKEFFKFG